MQSYARTQFMPFGAGRRICIGASFAMIELITVLANFVLAARFAVPGNTPEPIPVVRVTLRPKPSINLRITMR